MLRPNVCKSSAVFLPESGCSDCEVLKAKVEALQREVEILKGKLANTLELEMTDINGVSTTAVVYKKEN